MNQAAIAKAARHNSEVVLEVLKMLEQRIQRVLSASHKHEKEVRLLFSKLIQKNQQTSQSMSVIHK